MKSLHSPAGLFLSGLMLLASSAEWPANAAGSILKIDQSRVLYVYGFAGTTNEIQFLDAVGSSNGWITLTNIVIAKCPAVFADTSADGQSSRFYRIKAPAKPFDAGTEGLAWIPEGSFAMGSPTNEAGRYDNEGPQTDVTITYGFWMGKFEVTQEKFFSITGVNPSRHTGEPNLPVDSVSWPMATNYCDLLTKAARQTCRLPDGYVYRLPTATEWEYACRAGTASRFYFGEPASEFEIAVIADHAWCLYNSDNQTHQVGQKIPNLWELHDMNGNVWEWCADSCITNYPGGSATNYFVPFKNCSSPAIRGGGFDEDERSLRSANRTYDWTMRYPNEMGFRVVLAPPLPW